MPAQNLQTKPVENGRTVSAATDVKVLDPLIDTDWDNLASPHPKCSFFHCSAWARVLCETYGHKPLYLHLSSHDELVALVPLIEIRSPLMGRRAVCLPFSDACGPLVFVGNRSSLITEELSKLARERDWKYFEIRGGDGLEDSAQTASTFFGHELRLGGQADDVFQRFTNSTKGAVRQGLKSDLNVQVLQTFDAVREFYRLHVRTRRRHGVPPQPFAFFANLHQHVIKRGLGFVVLARTGLPAAAAAVFVRFGRKAIYKYAASDPKLARTRANNMVLWEAIRYLLEQGSEVLDFGRTSCDNDGLRRFKLSWGAEEQMIRYYRFDPKTKAWLSGGGRETGLHARIFRALPLALNRLAGTMLYPYLD